jgi:hypothetical protein
MRAFRSVHRMTDRRVACCHVHELPSGGVVQVQTVGEALDRALEKQPLKQYWVPDGFRG